MPSAGFSRGFSTRVGEGEASQMFVGPEPRAACGRKLRVARGQDVWGAAMST